MHHSLDRNTSMGRLQKAMELNGEVDAFCDIGTRQIIVCQMWWIEIGQEKTVDRHMSVED